LVPFVPDVDVSCSHGNVQLSLQVSKYGKDSMTGEIEKIARTVKGVENIEIRVRPTSDFGG
jgi:hypothetical protein